MKVCLCTIALNEMRWLPASYEQHRHWPGRASWIVVEGADIEYSKVNPDRVTGSGLSVDGTSGFLEQVSLRDQSFTYIQKGVVSAGDPAQGKCKLRQAYLDVMENIRPDYFVVLDADEFYPASTQQAVNKLMETLNAAGAYLRHREIWQPPSLQHGKLSFDYEAVGGFWSIPYCRLWKWEPGLKYLSNHNTPEVGGRLLDWKLARIDKLLKAPYFVHMAFASSAIDRKSKHRYYVGRGEGTKDRRGQYVQSRQCWETWLPGMPLPGGAKVVPYDGEVPECFR